MIYAARPISQRHPARGCPAAPFRCRRQEFGDPQSVYAAAAPFRAGGLPKVFTQPGHANRAPIPGSGPSATCMPRKICPLPPLTAVVAILNTLTILSVPPLLLSKRRASYIVPTMCRLRASPFHPRLSNRDVSTMMAAKAGATIKNAGSTSKRQPSNPRPAFTPSLRPDPSGRPRVTCRNPARAKSDMVAMPFLCAPLFIGMEASSSVPTNALLPPFHLSRSRCQNVTAHHPDGAAAPTFKGRGPPIWRHPRVSCPRPPFQSMAASVLPATSSSVPPCSFVAGPQLARYPICRRPAIF